MFIQSKSVISASTCDRKFGFTSMQQVSCISDKSIALGNLGVHKSIIREMYIHVLDGVLWSMF